MIPIDKYNPLSCDNYINAGNYFQKQLSNDSNLAIRTALVFAKIVGRGQDVLIHTGLGSIKLIVSTAMALYSVLAAVVPTHHKVAKEAFRHFAFALFFMADIPLSLTYILKMDPKPLCRKIQQKLSISCESLEFDRIINGFLETSDSCTKMQIEGTEKIYQENNLLEEENNLLEKENKLLENKNNLLEGENKVLRDEKTNLLDILQRKNTETRQLQKETQELKRTRLTKAS